MITYTKIDPSDEPISYNFFRENNDNDTELGSDHNSFTQTTLNAKEPDTQEQKGIISKITFNQQLVHEDPSVTKLINEMNLFQIQTKFPPPEHHFTTYMIIPPGKTLTQAFTKLIKNSLYSISRKAKILMMDKNIAKKVIPYKDDQNVSQYEDILILGTMAEKVDYSELEFIHLAKEEYPQWNQYYQKEKEKKNSENYAFLDRIYNYSKELDLENSNSLVYQVSILEDIIVTMFANVCRLTKLILRLKVDYPDHLRETLRLKTTLDELELEIKLEKIGKNSYQYTCQKPGIDESEINPISETLQNILKTFFDLEEEDLDDLEGDSEY